jgi:aminomuconate-semialdehyde/2-hydroxymuconate-6-semialdehyde dehydrogenase
MAPTVIEGLSYDCRVNQEEIFGPVVTISKFESFDELVEMANGVSYGLSATVWTEDAAKAQKLASHLDVGTVWINDWLQRDLHVPFGGMKQSGVGREGGMHSIDFFTETTTVVYHSRFMEGV